MDWAVEVVEHWQVENAARLKELGLAVIAAVVTAVAGGRAKSAASRRPWR
ncbi:hypothetical protein STENM327S_02394 [Streptomyces tendae]